MSAGALIEDMSDEELLVQIGLLRARVSEMPANVSIKAVRKKKKTVFDLLDEKEE